jgi:cell wall-associated NlpC family hydrolase
LNQNEFIKKILGKPWVNRAHTFGAVDCFGLVILYYQHVLRIDLPVVPGFDEKVNFVDCFNEGQKRWQEISLPNETGILFTCYHGDVPMHVGLCVGHGKVLHCRGSENQPGKVEIHSLRAIQRLYGKISYHKFIG